MVFFGNVIINEDVLHTETGTDEMMNNLCAGILIVFLVTGIYVNSHLIYYYKSHRPTWIDRYLWSISIARLVYIVTRSILNIIVLLNANTPIENLTMKWKFFLSIPSYLSMAALLALDAVIVSIQYGNIHHPLWTTRHGTFKVTKYVVSAVVILFTAGSGGATIHGEIHRSRGMGNTTFPPPKASVHYTAISFALFVLLSLFIISVYLTNWIRYWHQTGAVVVGKIIRREFWLVTVLVLSDVVDATCSAVFLANLELTRDAGTLLYIWFFSDTMVPLLVSSLSGGYMLFSEKNIREHLTGICRRGRSGNEINMNK
jgi:hypothetical protein